MEEQILLYYLKKSSFLLIFLFLFNFFHLFFIKEISLINNNILIQKDQNYSQIIDQNLDHSSLNLWFYKAALRIILINNIKIHYGKFIIEDKKNFIEIIKIITAPSNNFEKITIIEGSSKKKLSKIFQENFTSYNTLEYNEVIADTYYYNYDASFIELKKKIERKVNKLKKNHKNTSLKDIFTFDEIFIIGSLLEKEGMNYSDKKNIYSVIFNRLKLNMKLQIDATVIYALTKGNYKLNRRLTLDDLKIIDNFNTYYIYGLPPKAISYVGLKTIELIYENYKTNYLFYFYNSLENKHIFSENYGDHLSKLNEYRSKK